MQINTHRRMRKRSIKRLKYIVFDSNSLRSLILTPTLLKVSPFLILFYLFIFISWRLITSQYCSGFCHTLTSISHGFTCVPHPHPLSHLPLHPIPLVFPVHQAWALVSCIQPRLVICFTLDNIHVSMLFSRNIPPSPSPTESKIFYFKSQS